MRYSVPKFFFIALVIFSITFKYIEFGTTNIAAYHIVVLSIFVYVCWSSRRIRYTLENSGVLKNHLPFPLYLFIAYIFATHFTLGASLPLIYIYISALLIYLSTYILCTLLRDYQFIFISTITSLCIFSSILLLIQTNLGISKTIFSVLQETYLADPSEVLSNPDDLIVTRGVGLSLTITDFATHVFVPFFYLIIRSINKFPVLKLRYIVLSLLLWWAIFVNASTAALLGLLFGFGILYFRRVYILALFVILVTVFTFQYEELVSFLTDSAIGGQEVYGSSIVSRLFMWAKAISIYVQSPFVGLGLGNHLNQSNLVEGFFYVNMPDVEIAYHSWFFDLLAGTGGIGLLLFSWFLLNTLYAGWRVQNSCQDDYLNLVLMASFCAYLIFGLFNNMHYMNYDIYIISAIIHFRFFEYKRQRTNPAFLQPSSPNYA